MAVGMMLLYDFTQLFASFEHDHITGCDADRFTGHRISLLMPSEDKREFSVPVQILIGIQSSSN